MLGRAGERKEASGRKGCDWEIPLPTACPGHLQAAAGCSLFAEDFGGSPCSPQATEPGGKVRGKGVFLIHKVPQIREWTRDSQTSPCVTQPTEDAYMVSVINTYH